jgi:hypothetical protein
LRFARGFAMKSPGTLLAKRWTLGRREAWSESKSGEELLALSINALLVPDPVWQWQACKVLGAELSVRFNTEALEHGDHLAHVLRRVPSRALEQLVHRRRAIKGLDLLLARLVLEPYPPLFDSSNDALAVGRDLCCGDAASIFGRYVGVVRPVFDAIYRGLEEGFADAKDVVTQQPDRAITVINGAFVESVMGNLADVALRRTQHGDPFFFQHCGRKGNMSGPLQADKFGDVLQVLTENILVALCKHRHSLRAELEQLLSSCRVV